MIPWNGDPAMPHAADVGLKASVIFAGLTILAIGLLIG